MFSPSCEPLFILDCDDLLTLNRYDVTGVPADRIQRVLEHDWMHLVHNKRILDSPNYLREQGRLVVALWGASQPGVCRPLTYTAVEQDLASNMLATRPILCAASLNFSAMPLPQVSI